MLPSDDGYGVEPESAWGTLGQGESLATVPAERGSYGGFYSGLADAMLRGAAVPVDPRDSLRVIEIIEQIHRSTS
jgi:scyllo-inositol 2-dehydrogenase (NADP+)